MITKILTAAGIFGFIPLSMSSSKCNIVWPSILLIFYVVRSILHVQVFCEFEIFFTIAHPVAFAVLQTSQFIMQCLFIGSSITGCLLRIKKFQIFIKKLQPQKDELASRKCLMIILVSHVLYSVQLYIELEKYTSDDLPIKSIVFHWGDYQSAQYTQFFMAFFISCLGGIITTRYKTIKRNLEVTISVLIHYKDVPKTYVRQKLKPIKKSYAELYVLVGEFNSLFSWPSLLLTIGIPFNAMAGFEFLVLYKYGITSLKMSFTIQLCISTIFIYSFMHSCDSIQRSGTEITKMCYFLQENAVDPCLAKELINMGQYAENLTPAITAAGFIEINKSLFSTMVSTVIMYMMICLQFGSK